MNKNQPRRWIWAEVSPLLVAAASIPGAQLPSLPSFASSALRPAHDSDGFGCVLSLPHTSHGAGLSLAAGQSQPSPTSDAGAVFGNNPTAPVSLSPSPGQEDALSNDSGRQPQLRAPKGKAASP